VVLVEIRGFKLVQNRRQEVFTRGALRSCGGALRMCRGGLIFKIW